MAPTRRSKRRRRSRAKLALLGLVVALALLTAFVFRQYIQCVVTGASLITRIQTSDRDGWVIGLLHCHQRFSRPWWVPTVAGYFNDANVQRPRGDPEQLCARVQKLDEVLRQIPGECLDRVDIHPVLAGVLRGRTGDRDALQGFNTDSGYAFVDGSYEGVNHVLLHEVMHLVERTYGTAEIKESWRTMEPAVGKPIEGCSDRLGFSSSVARQSMTEDMVETMACLVDRTSHFEPCSHADATLRQKGELALTMIERWCPAYRF